MTPKPTLRRRQKERGQTILLVAISLVTLLGMTALAIDVVTLYVSRAEAQRAADAAALAGAKMLVDTGLTTDPCNSTLASAAQTLAMNQAMLVAAQNNVSGQAPTATVTFPNGTGTTSCPNSFGINPQVKVVVQRTGLPTFFSRIWGSALGSVSASAVAEGYNPSGSAGLNTTGSVIPISPRCTKPIILPNCDPDTSHSLGGLSQCGGGTHTFIDATTGTISNPGLFPTGVIGEYFQMGGIPPQLVSGCDPTQAGSGCVHPLSQTQPVAGQYYPLALSGGALHLCPSCASGTSGFQPDIECCNASTVTCGQQYAFDPTVYPEGGAMQNGLQCLIHQAPSSGQDRYDNSTSSPVLFIAGDNNPFASGSGTIQPGDHIMTSDSIVTVPLYDGVLLPTPGTNFTVIGYLQLFIDSVDTVSGKITAHILNVSGCGSAPVRRQPPSRARLRRCRCG